MWRKAKRAGRALLQHTFIAGQQDYGRYANRNYRSRKAKLMPTDTGTVVNDFLMEYFPNILDYNFTASVEKQFDEIAEGEKKWTAILKDFYKDFHPSVENTLATKNAHKAGERILGEEPGSGKQVSVKSAVSVPLYKSVLPETTKSHALPNSRKICPLRQ